MDEEVSRMIQDTVKESVETSRQTLLQEIGTLFDKISEQNNSSQLTRISSLVQQDQPTFKKKSNEEQFKANSKVLLKLKEVNASLEQQNVVEAQSKITEGLLNLIYLIVSLFKRK